MNIQLQKRNDISSRIRIWTRRLLHTSDKCWSKMLWWCEEDTRYCCWVKHPLWFYLLLNSFSYSPSSTWSPINRNFQNFHRILLSLTSVVVNIIFGNVSYRVESKHSLKFDINTFNCLQCRIYSLATNPPSHSDEHGVQIFGETRLKMKIRQFSNLIFFYLEARCSRVYSCVVAVVLAVAVVRDQKSNEASMECSITTCVRKTRYYSDGNSKLSSDHLKTKIYTSTQRACWFQQALCLTALFVSTTHSFTIKIWMRKGCPDSWWYTRCTYRATLSSEQNEKRASERKINSYRMKIVYWKIYSILTHQESSQKHSIITVGDILRKKNRFSNRTFPSFQFHIPLCERRNVKWMNELTSHATSKEQSAEQTAVIETESECREKKPDTRYRYSPQLN